ncbi:hypothetical protein ACFE04_005968 [Oxalis oulophora]
MKNFLKKLHMMSNQSEDTAAGGGEFSSPSSPRGRPHQTSDNTPLSGLSNWLNSVGNRKSPSPPTSSNVRRAQRNIEQQSDTATTSSGIENALETFRMIDSGSSSSKDPDVEEEYQIQLALELSAKEDPEAVQIEAVKQISLGSCGPQNTPAEVVAYRYWNYNSLSYDDKISDGFYDLYGIMNESAAEKMPSLVDLQGTPVFDGVTWEAILVNRSADANLLRLEKKSLKIAVKSRSELVYWATDLVKKLAVLVSDFMGGPVADPDNILRAWQNLSYRLKATLGSMVLPIGSLTIGLARHRALLFKVLADSVGLPCRLVKGQQYTGSDDAAVNFVKIDDGREYIVDVMAAPGTFIPADAAGTQLDYADSCFTATPLSRDVAALEVPSSSSGIGSSFEEHSNSEILDKKSKSKNISAKEYQLGEKNYLNPTNLMITTKGNEDSKADSKYPFNVGKLPVRELPNKTSHPYVHARSPSWTEGVSSPAVRRMKVKDVSQYMIDAAKENPNLAQKLHDVLLESGVVAPPNLFTEVYAEQLEASTVEDTSPTEENKQRINTPPIRNQDELGLIRYLPPLPHNKTHLRANQPEYSPDFESIPVKNYPVATVAALTAAVVASSMVAAVNKQQSHGDGEGSSSGEREHGIFSGANSEVERTSDKSTSSVRSDHAFDDGADCEIPFEDITLGERIGLGSYGEVYRGDWHGTEVAVKRFLDQGITGESLEEFKSEVWIMKRIRHPNVVLFLGAITRAPNLSIVTEFLPRGSLYRLLHRPNNQLDERRRLRMALDAARGMNYLHNCTPVIVHRDLKSPNLLVDKNWVVKVCDFGLSRMKYSTFLSSRSTAGTAEWMAPEVLRNEPSDEKCDVYSFGVILWELITLQQPWGGMNPMQVVGAVGFQHRRLEIPDSLDPAVANIIRQCWQTDPRMRPTFMEIMAALKPLQKPITGPPVPRPSPPTSSSRDKGQPSRVTEYMGN